MSRIRTQYINKNTLIRIYGMFKKNHNKPFLATDFSIEHNKIRECYLDILLKLNLIKKVEVVYFCGKKYGIKHETEGYKLKIEKRMKE